MRTYRSESERELSGDVVAAMFLHQITRQDMAQLLGMSRPMLVARLEGRRRWQIAEVERARQLLPRLGSNQQPADYGSAA